MGVVIEFPKEEAERRHKAKLTPAGWQYFPRPSSITWLRGFDAPFYGTPKDWVVDRDPNTEFSIPPCDTEDKP